MNHFLSRYPFIPVWVKGSTYTSVLFLILCHYNFLFITGMSFWLHWSPGMPSPLSLVSTHRVVICHRYGRNIRAIILGLSEKDTWEDLNLWRECLLDVKVSTFSISVRTHWSWRSTSVNHDPCQKWSGQHLTNITTAFHWKNIFADSVQTEYCPTFLLSVCSCVRVSQAWHLTFLTYIKA